MDLRKLEIMATDCMRHHGLLDKGWRFVWCNRKTNFGYCWLNRKTLGFSIPLTRVNSEDRMLDCILHEIAHALVGPGHSHDITWHLLAKSIGAKGDRCGTGGVTVPGNYQAVCPGCGTTHHYHRRPKQSAKRCRCFRGHAWNVSQHLIFEEVN